MSSRILYIDHAKAIAILLVVVGHLIYFNVFDENTNDSNQLLLNRLIGVVQMPLFILCSGLVVKSDCKVSYAQMWQMIYKKVRTLLFPFLIVGISYAYLKDYDFVSFITKTMKLGYWYLLTLFELYILHYLYMAINKTYFNSRFEYIFDVIIACFVYGFILLVYNSFGGG